MALFKDVVYDAASSTATIGTGLVWDEVYEALVEPHGVNVVGGRVTGVGVAGFTLGGGTNLALFTCEYANANCNGKAIRGRAISMG